MVGDLQHYSSHTHSLFDLYFNLGYSWAVLPKPRVTEMLSNSGTFIVISRFLN